MEQFTEDLYVRFRNLLEADNKGAVTLYERMLDLLNTERDKELDEPWEMKEMTPEQYHEMHKGIKA